MARCRLCGLSSPALSARMGWCGECLRTRFAEVRGEVLELHGRTRAPFGLPPEPVRDPGGVVCDRCLNACRLGEGRVGYCGLRKNQGGRLVGGDADSARVAWYDDPLPTNCVADWVCPGGTGAGYPAYAAVPGPERGCYNLAVFYRACSFNCLFCQNWHFKQETFLGPPVTAAKLAQAVGPDTTCLCFFGGDPTPQVAHALETARLAREAAKGKVLRVCWETNGSAHPRFLKEMVRVSLDSGGCIKFDLKAHSPDLHRALCGVGNEQTLANFKKAAAFIDQRPEPPLVVASTLLVPGYVDPKEVSRLAGFIAEVHPDIPYALLAFHPHFFLDDLPTTSRRHAAEALEAAQAAGLTRVRLGNVHLLGGDY